MKPAPAKIEVLLKKINELADGLRNRPMSAIDRDLLLQYLRTLYAEVLAMPLPEGEGVEQQPEKVAGPSPQKEIAPAQPIDKELAREEMKKEEKASDPGPPAIEFVDESKAPEEDALDKPTKKEGLESLSMEERTQRVDDIHRELEALKKEREAQKQEQSPSQPEDGVTPSEPIITPPGPAPEVPAQPSQKTGEMESGEKPSQTVGPKTPKTEKPADKKAGGAPKPDEEDISLYEKFQEGEDKGLAEQMKKNPIQDLRSEIDINDRFWFINELFDGNGDKFKTHIKKLNELHNYHEAANYVEQEIQPHYDWGDKDNVVEKFMRLVRRRYL